MLSFFADIFGYILNFLYTIVSNYGVAIILFSVLVKIVMLPLSIKQQRTMKKSVKLQEELKQIQYKYKSQPEKLNAEMMDLYKREKMNPFSGCLSAIIQIILLFSMFLLVRSPLTYMVKMDEQGITRLEEITLIAENNANDAYKEISIIQYIKSNKDSISVDENDETTKNYIEQADLEMNFLGIDLSQIPTQDLSNWRTLIIPVLYVISSFISIRLTTAMQNKKKDDKNLITDGKEKSKEEEINPVEEANKSMSWIMPIMSISIAIIAPLGLALYWLTNNILMIGERILLNKILEKEEAKENA